jgi:hypothetical protein
MYQYSVAWKSRAARGDIGESSDFRTTLYVKAS